MNLPSTPRHRHADATPLRLHEAGLTLVELMVASAIMLIILTGLLQMMSVNIKISKVQKNLAVAQDSARMVLNMMSEPVRMAGNGRMTPTEVFFTDDDFADTNINASLIAGPPLPGLSDSDPAVPLFATRIPALDMPTFVVVSGFNPGSLTYTIEEPSGLYFGGSPASGPLDAKTSSDVGKIILCRNRTRDEAYFTTIAASSLPSALVVTNSFPAGGWATSDEYELFPGMTEYAFAYRPQEHAVYRRVRGLSSASPPDLNPMNSNWIKVAENIYDPPVIRFVMSDGSLRPEPGASTAPESEPPAIADKINIRGMQVRVIGMTPDFLPTHIVTDDDMLRNDYIDASSSVGEYGWDTVEMFTSYFTISTRFL